MSKKALLVGINYPGTQHQLNGCVNDVSTMSEVLSKYFGFSSIDKRMLTDASATTANILERLNWLVDGATPGDVLYFHYSGHGSQMICTDYNTNDEPDGLDEVIVPIDMNWREKIIKDDDLKQIFSKVPSDVNLTVVLDCCHSGSGLRGGIMSPEMSGPNKTRLLPMPADIANRGIGLNLKPKPRTLQSQIVPYNEQTGLLISGCKADQTSADAWIHNKYMGACTYYLIDTLAKSKFSLGYETLVKRMNRVLKKYGYTQKPELNGNEMLFKKRFLHPFVM